MIRERLPDLSAEELAALLKSRPKSVNVAVPSPSHTPAPSATGDGDASTGGPSLFGDFPETASSSTSVSPAPRSSVTTTTAFAAHPPPLTVSMPFPVQSLDVLQPVGEGGAESHEFPPRAPSLHRDVVSNGGILIHEKYQDLFVSPPPSISASMSHESLDRADDASSVNTPVAATAADNESFYPEDEEEQYGVSV